MVKKIFTAGKIILLFIIAVMGVCLANNNFAQAAYSEGVDWDVVYDYINNDGNLSDERPLGGFLSLATKSNGYPGIAYSYRIDNNDNWSGLRYVECNSGSDCALGDGGGRENWGSEITVETPASGIRYGTFVSLDYGSDNKPVILHAYNPMRIAKYTGSGTENSCAGGNNNWKCFSLGNSDYAPNSDFVIDSNGNYHIVYTNNNDYDLNYAFCDMAASGCDETGDFQFYEIHHGIYNQAARIDADSSGNLHVAFTDSTTTLYYKTCNFSSTGCNDSTDWSSATTIDSSAVMVGDIEAKAGILAIAYAQDSGYQLHYAEYVGSGGTGCSSSDWTCASIASTYTPLHPGNNSALSLEMDISSSGERGLAYNVNKQTISPENKDFIAEYSHCTANCTTPSNWNRQTIFYTNQINMNHFGILSSVEFGSGPRVAFSDTVAGDLYYGEQGGDEPPLEDIVPELPQSNIWKIVIAVLALGMVIGIVAWRNKNKE